MVIRTNVVREWHHLCVVFYENLLDGCLDEGKRLEIHSKINHHRSKLAGLAMNSAS